MILCQICSTELKYGKHVCKECFPEYMKILNRDKEPINIHDSIKMKSVFGWDGVSVFI